MQINQWWNIIWPWQSFEMNSIDSYLLSRTNHTWTQSVSTLSDLTSTALIKAWLSGWQIVYWWTWTANNLDLYSTSHWTKWQVRLWGADGFIYNETLNCFGNDWATFIHTLSWVSITSNFELHSEGSTDIWWFAIHRYTDSSALGSHILNLRSNWTHTAPTIVANNNIVSRYISAWYDWIDYHTLCEIRCEVDWTPWVNDMPWRFVFLTTSDWNNTPVESMRISNNKSMTLQWVFTEQWTKRWACWGWAIWVETTANWTVSLEINWNTYKLLYSN